MSELGGAPRGGAARRFAAALDAVLPARAAKVAVLAEQGDEVAALVAQVRPGAAVVTYDVGLPILDRHADLTAGAPWDAVVDAGPARQRARRVLATYYHLRVGGVLVLRGRDRFGAIGTVVDRGRTPGAVRSPDTPADLERLLESLADRGRSYGYPYLVRGGTPAWAKLHEASGTRVLELRPEIGRVVRTLPAQTFTRRCTVRTNDPDRRLATGTEISSPAIALREYHDVVVDSRQLVVRDRMLLPDSFRHNTDRRLANKRLEEVAWLFARPRHRLRPSDRLAGTYYHLDNEARGHFGHILTEQISRLWGWAQAKAEHPELKALVAVRGGRELRSWEYDLLDAAGIAAEDVVFLRQAATVEHLISAAPMFSNPVFVHPDITRFWDPIGDTLAARATRTGLPGRVFIGRRTDKRLCRNADEVQARFVAHGFTIVYPEDYSLADQVALFRGAQVVAGYAGSGLFTTCFVQRPLPVVTIGSQRYSPRNEYLIAAVRGHPLTMITSRPDDPDDMNSAYEVDFDREGRLLDEVLAELT